MCSENFSQQRILGGAIGNCVHVAGVFTYLQLAEQHSWETMFLGAAVEPESFAAAVMEFNPDIVCVSYRLTPAVLRSLLDRFFDCLANRDKRLNRLYYFGGTPGCIDVAKRYHHFSVFFQGEEKLSFLRQTLLCKDLSGNGYHETHERLAVDSNDMDVQTVRNIINEHRYVPMLRHHFGLPTLNETITGIELIAKSEQVDIISLAPDQNAQEFFFHPHKMNKELDGSGGIPVRSESDLKQLWDAAQTGNHPRLRIYAGTNNLLEWADMSLRTIKNAWGAIPLFWYSILDGRAKRGLEEAITENQKVIRWYADRGIPVEINESHHWSLRESSDTIAVADFYIAAYNAKKMGVKIYIAQLMFNTPRLTSGKMDLAKMLAKIEFAAELEDDSFICLRQVRAGLTHFSIDMDVAKGQLASSTLLSLALKPQIIHVVSFSEADHAAQPEDVIESCKIVKGVLRNTWREFPDLTLDPDVQARKELLLMEARALVNNIRETFANLSPDPLSDPGCLTLAIGMGLLDAPHLRNNPAALGKIRTLPIKGGYDAVDNYGIRITEAERIKRINQGMPVT